ncbi:MAG: TetR/AcrR family transcriptional regulator [Pseudomonadota bacterium]
MTEFSPIRTRKCQQIMQGAAKVFAEHGFDGSSSDELADRIGVSKATLYKYFPTKEQLFETVLLAECVRHREQILEPRFDNLGAPEDILLEVARRLGRIFSSKVMISLFRLVIGEGQKFDKVLKAFFEAGPEATVSAIASLLDDMVADGRMDPIDDTKLAASQFKELAKIGVFYPSLFEGRTDLSAAQLEQHAADAVSAFLKIYPPCRNVCA